MAWGSCRREQEPGTKPKAQKRCNKITSLMTVDDDLGGNLIWRNDTLSQSGRLDKYMDEVWATLRRA